ncbi:hypothetical protein [Nostoc sp. TCL240-02]|uniref:hypothetical protein n=1 Tax=Nostoc sp. TCL240-02 TaxID=2572090 RepID=UPI00157FAC81|nr:hypothetical protein [Nostoc sp. TCL240-02]QKQ73473.1 hypothetical protein FBB35_09095 [Nostoc sp. TCL240-02]
MKYSLRKQSKKGSTISFEQVQQEPPLWKSPLTWLCAAGGVLLIGIPLVMDNVTHRVNSAFLVDISLSNQPYQTSLEALCRQYVEHLVEGDVRILGKFADRAIILSNQEFQERDRLSIQNQCKYITTQPSGIGRVPGTSLIDALSRLETEIGHQQSQDNTRPVAAVVVIQAAELVNHQQQDFTVIKSKIEAIIHKGGALAIIGPDVDLQNQLSSQLSSVKNTQICTYSDGQACLDWLFQIGRK